MADIEVLKICPACNDNFIPNNDTPYAHVGAISRVDNETEICSACGLREAQKISRRADQRR